MPFDPRTSMFMCDNFVASPVNQHNNSGRIPMVAVPADPAFYFCVTKSGKPMDIYEIREAPQAAPGGQAQNGIFMGYWCPYDIDRTSYVTLSGAADYMFTATMDGCSFGVGTPSKDGTVTVSHSNSAKDDTATSHKPMAVAQKAANHVRAHPAQSHHSDLHMLFSTLGARLPMRRSAHTHGIAPRSADQLPARP